MVINLICDLNTKKNFFTKCFQSDWSCHHQMTAKIHPPAISSPVHVIPPVSANDLASSFTKKTLQERECPGCATTDLQTSVHLFSLSLLAGYGTGLPHPSSASPSTFLGTCTSEERPSISSVSCFLLYPFPV